MSLILDALNRSRGETDREAVPSLDSVHFTDRPPRQWLPWGLAVGAVVALLLVVWVTVRVMRETAGTPPPGPEKSAAQLAAEAARTQAQSVPAQPPQSQPRPAPQPVTLGGRVDSNPRPAALPEATDSVAESSQQRQPSAAVTALYDNPPAAVSEPDTASPDNAESTLADGGGESTGDTAADAPVASATSEGAATREIPIDVAEVLRRAQQDLGQPGLSDHPVPVLDTLSQQTKDGIPTVVYSAHDYQPDGQSSVTLNGNRLTAGQRAEGFQVKEILVDSVVLSWGGTDFRLRALNSWINL